MCSIPQGVALGYRIWPLQGKLLADCDGSFDLAHAVEREAA